MHTPIATKKLNLKSMHRWKPPRDWVRITAIDAHTGGEPFRVIVGGFPEPSGETILAKRRWLRKQFDHLRTAIMWEPRGHADMYGCILTPPVTPGADLGILFMHNEGYSTMCGHGIIAITKVVLETELIPMKAPETSVRFDSPAGLVTAHARVSDGEVKSVYFHNVPSFVLAKEETVEVQGFGRVVYDIAFGGAYYAYVQAADVCVTCTPKDFRPLIEKGMAIKRAIMESRPIPHPLEPELGFLYGTILIGPSQASDVHSRNVCIFADGEVDRSPTGTGISGRLAIHHSRGEVDLNERIVVESIIGSRFSGRVVETTTFGDYPAVITEIEGTAHITGRQEFLIDPSDPLRNGFILR
jgi:proline racemase